ncbi:MAG TPA: VCBS repeat-containing protein [Ohtaekwangia sp.]|nr:VCBS repeat-containing protein [Ohtaekwangia sp.]
MTRPFPIFACLSILLCINACSDSTNEKKRTDAFSQFTLLSPEKTGIAFVNAVKDQKDFNVFTYRNFYNGGGVAIGDINNDSLPDIYFTANMAPNKLYLNKGNFQFEDITETALVKGTKSWSTGVTMTDVNNDGYLDIYVCNSGDLKGGNKENELYINNGDLTFTESAAAYKLHDKGFSTHASFFDFDQDGDLDCYLLNNSFKSIERVDQFLIKREDRDKEGGDKLLRNDGGYFTDVSEEAGIYGGWIGFGLGVSVSDLNEDMLPDIYVSNDFWERDYLYINRGNGTFSEEITSRTSILSASSMGSDVADLNNDGYADIFTTEMLPADNVRLKTMAKFEETNIKELKVRSSYHYQIMQNCLHFNEGDGRFQELAPLANVAATDWSWGSLMFDMNNDGWKDIFVSNGIYRDITSMDFSDFVADRDNIKKIVHETGKFDFEDLLALVPSSKISNYGFLNQHGKVFQNATDSLGLGLPSFSNGAAYGDLDNDGDMDLVVNNINSPAFIYKNNGEKEKTHAFLKVKFNGPEKNTFGIGAKVFVYTNRGKQVFQNFMARGFQSSVEPCVLVGLGKAAKVDSMVVIWPDRKKQVIKDIGINQTIVAKYAEAKELFNTTSKEVTPLLQDVSSHVLKENYTHKENSFNDFDHERLLPRAVSTEGPEILTGDLNGDSLEDFVLLGAAGASDKIFYQNTEGMFTEYKENVLAADSVFESTCGAIFDRDNDGDLDILIGSGGNERQTSLRYYENDGKGRFTRQSDAIPNVVGDFSCIVTEDFDQDGNTDLFIGGRIIPGNYGVIPNSYLFQNEGKTWKDVTPNDLKQAGMVTAAIWSDADQDGKNDLIVTGEWMPVIIFRNTGTALAPGKALANTEGWWTAIKKADLNSDGLEDIVLGNWGLNSKFKTSVDKPMKMFVNDFDSNGKTEFVITWYPPAENTAYPFATKMDLTAQLPFLKKKNLKYADFATKTYDDLFSSVEKEGVKTFVINQLQSSILFNQGKLNYELRELPIEAQVSPVFAIAVNDFDGDNIADLLLCGNFYKLKPEVGRQDANHGVILKGDGKGNFYHLPSIETGIYIKGEVRDIKQIKAGSDNIIIIGRNNAPVIVLKKSGRDLH